MNNKIIKNLIPVVAVIIIFESIMLVSSLEKKKNISGPVTQKTEVNEDINKESSLDLVFETDSKEMKVGKKYKVSLNLIPKNNFNLNALDLYVKYNPDMFTLSDLLTGKELTKADFNKISSKKMVTATNFLFTEKEGMLFVKDKESELITFNVIPKKSGISSFEISTGDSEGDSVTMFVDKVTSKSLPFSSNKLEVNLIN